MSPDKRFILASESPRRRELLSLTGYGFEVIPAEVDEGAAEGDDPAERAVSSARLKAMYVAERHPDRLVLGADTVVVLGRKVLGKPASADEARWMLSVLSGRVHRVITGYAVVHLTRLIDHIDFASTRVKIKALSPAEIDYYVATGEPMDKAGAYAIQGIGGALVEWIHGSYTNVVGLPLTKVLDRLVTLGGLGPPEPRGAEPGGAQRGA